MKNNASSKQLLLEAALLESEQSHYLKVTREAIAARAGVAGPLIQYHYNTMAQFRRAIVGEAIRTGNLTVLAQALVAGDSRVIDLSKKLKKQIANSIAR